MNKTLLRGKIVPEGTKALPLGKIRKIIPSSPTTKTDLEEAMAMEYGAP
jgi:hypothetical protein